MNKATWWDAATVSKTTSFLTANVIEATYSFGGLFPSLIANAVSSVRSRRPVSAYIYNGRPKSFSKHRDNEKLNNKIKRK